MSKKNKELLNKDDATLAQELEAKQKHLFDLRSQAVTEKLEDNSQIGKAKKDIARIKTIQSRRRLATATN